jgi:MFS family permease
MTTGELGTWLAVVYGGGGLVGTYVGGELAARYAANNERLQLLALAVLYAAFGVLTVAVYLSPSYAVAFVALGLSAIGGAATNGPIFAATQTLMPPRMRALSIAVVLFFCNLIGMGFGPLAAGALSDALQPMFHDDSLRYALVAFCPGYLWCAWHLWQASKTVHDDVAAVVGEVHVVH